MKKVYYLIYMIILLTISLWIYLFSSWEQLIVNLILINIIIYVVQKPIIGLLRFLIKKKIIQIFISSIINIVWCFFIFWLVLVMSVDFFIAVVSYVLISISFTFKDIISNITAGAMMLTSEQFELGDLIETNNIQGIVYQINLNHTKIREFDGVSIILPNDIVYGSSLLKFSHRRYSMLDQEKKAEDIKNKKQYRKYIKKLEKVIAKKQKITKYVKSLEFLGEIPPKQLDASLNIVFNKYEALLGYRPNYRVDTTTYGRIKVFIYLISNTTEEILNNIDSFLRDITYKIYNKMIYDGWDTYKKGQLRSNSKGEVSN